MQDNKAAGKRALKSMPIGDIRAAISEFAVLSHDVRPRERTGETYRDASRDKEAGPLRGIAAHSGGHRARYTGGPDDIRNAIVW